MATVELSVIMAVRNAMPELSNAVESVLKQTFQNFEFIIVDDFRSDETGDYLHRLKDSRAGVLPGPRHGQTPGLNQALECARAGWIARMDGDEWSYPERFQLQWEAAKSHPGAVLISADYTVCEDDLAPVATVRLQSNGSGPVDYLRRRNNPFC